MKNWIYQLQQDNRRSIALAILRIFISIHLLKKIFFEWGNMEMIYGSNSLISHIPIKFAGYTFDADIFRSHLPFILSIYLIIIILFFFGIGKNITNLFVLLFVTFFQRLDWYILNGGDNLLFFLVLYLMFADSYQYFSITKLSFRSDKTRRLVNLTSNLAGYCIMLQFCLIYTVSAMHKLHADVWFNGIAVYYTLQLERFRGTGVNAWIAKNEWLVTISTYATIFFELYFPVLIFFRKFRPYLIIAGLGLHIGIYIFMMIYDFQLVFIFTYIAFLTNDEIRASHKRFLLPLIERFRSRKAALQVSRSH